MKKLLVICLLALTVFSLHTSIASARDVTAYHIGTYRINPKRTERIKGRRRRLDNAIYIMSLQLGANQTSLRNLDYHLAHFSMHRTKSLYRQTCREYQRINHHKLSLKGYGLNR